jgi:cobalt-zinc-cadmium efflux system protein
MDMEQSNGSNSKKIGTAFLLNISFTVVELIGGILTGSIAIIADAVHDFSDSLSLGISWYMERKSEKKPNARFPFGYKRFSLRKAINNLFHIRTK